MRYRRLSYSYGEYFTSSRLKRLGNLMNYNLTATLSEPLWQPATDFYETPTALIIKAELAGMTEENFEITLYHDVLVIEGVRPWRTDIT